VVMASLESELAKCAETDYKPTGSLTCNAVGFCDSAATDYGWGYADSLGECIQMCKDDPRCKWYSYSVQECMQMPVIILKFLHKLTSQNLK